MSSSGMPALRCALTNWSEFSTGTALSSPVPPASGFLNQSIAGTPTKGVYIVVFPSKAQIPPLAASAYPRGDGFATLTLTNAGAVNKGTNHAGFGSFLCTPR